MKVKDILSEIEKKMEGNNIGMIQMHNANPMLVYGFKAYDNMVVLYDRSDMNSGTVSRCGDVIHINPRVDLFIKELRKLDDDLEVCLDSQYGQKAVCLCEADDSLIIVGEDELP